MRGRGWCAALAAAALVAGLGTASAGEPPAGDVEAARALANAGFQLYASGQYEQALERFRSAEALYHAPTHRLFMARAHAKLGQLLRARDLYREVALAELAPEAPEPFRAAQQSAREELAALEPRIPALRIELAGDRRTAARVTIDGEAVAGAAQGSPIPLDPGRHLVVARAPDAPEARAAIELVEGDGTKSLKLRVGRSVTPPTQPVAEGEETASDGEEPSVVPPVLVMAAGLALGGVGVVTGIVAMNEAAELNELCPANPCPEEHEPRSDSVYRVGTVSTVALIVGGAAFGAGLLWLLLQPTANDEGAELARPFVTPYVGAFGGGIRGQY